MPRKRTHPGEVLREEYLVPLGISARALAKSLGVPAGPINDVEQVFKDPQVIHRGMKLDLPSEAAKAGSIPGVRTPIVIDGWKAASEKPAPLLGQHTQEILKEIGEG